MKLSLSIDSWCELFAEQAKNSSSVFWVSSLDYQEHIFISPSFEAIWGVSPELLYQKRVNFNEFIEYNANNKFYNYCVARHNTLDGGNVLFDIESSDGTVKRIRDRFMTLYDRSGNAVAAAGISIDVSDQADMANDIKIYQAVDEEHQIIAASYSGVIKERLKLLTTQPDSAVPILSKREKQCAKQLVVGKTAQQTADVLFISRRTVEKHIENIKIKFNCSRKVDLVKLLVERNLTDIQE